MSMTKRFWDGYFNSLSVTLGLEQYFATATLAYIRENLCFLPQYVSSEQNIRKKYNFVFCVRFDGSD
jgi:hypothetical protein